MADCENCGTPDSEKPTIFRGEKYCSDICRKILSGELPRETYVVTDHRK